MGKGVTVGAGVDTWVGGTWVGTRVGVGPPVGTAVGTDTLVGVSVGWEPVGGVGVTTEVPSGSSSWVGATVREGSGFGAGVVGEGVCPAPGVASTVSVGSGEVAGVGVAVGTMVGGSWGSPVLVGLPGTAVGEGIGTTVSFGDSDVGSVVVVPGAVVERGPSVGPPDVGCPVPRTPVAVELGRGLVVDVGEEPPQERVPSSKRLAAIIKNRCFLSPTNLLIR